MGWAAIIAALITALGPLISQLLQDCAKKKAVKAGEELDADVIPVPADKEEAYKMALEQILNDTRGPLRRMFVKHAIKSVPKALASGVGLSDDDVAELTALGKVM